MNTPPQHAEDQCRRTAFTLVELLVVTAVTGILIALLMPVLARSVDRAEAVTCVGNLRQWGLATGLYGVDSGGVLPWDGAPNGISTTRAWYADLPPLLGIRPYHEEGAWRTNSRAPLGNSLWFCPSNPRRSNGNLLFHYCLNRELNGNGDNTVQTRVDGVPEPSRTVWLFDNGRRAASAGRGNLHTNLHGNGANILFVDASVRRCARPASPGQTNADAGSLDLVWRP